MIIMIMIIISSLRSTMGVPDTTLLQIRIARMTPNATRARARRDYC